MSVGPGAGNTGCGPNPSTPDIGSVLHAAELTTSTSAMATGLRCLFLRCMGMRALDL
jgi:hypothetical protein